MTGRKTLSSRGRTASAWRGRCFRGAVCGHDSRGRPGKRLPRPTQLHASLRGQDLPGRTLTPAEIQCPYLTCSSFWCPCIEPHLAIGPEHSCDRARTRARGARRRTLRGARGHGPERPCAQGRCSLPPGVHSRSAGGARGAGLGRDWGGQAAGPSGTPGARNLIYNSE